MRYPTLVVAIAVMVVAALPARAQEAPWTDDLIAQLVARDASAFSEAVVARMPDSYADVKRQVLDYVPSLGRLLDGLKPVHADPANDRAPTASVRCRSYFIHGASPFAVVFHLYRPADEWLLLAFNLKQLSPENFATYVRQMCEERPIPEN